MHSYTAYLSAILVKSIQTCVLAGTIVALIGVALYLGIDLHRSGREQVLHQFNTTQLLLAQEVAHDVTSHLKEYAEQLDILARLTSIQRGDPELIREDLARYSPTQEVSHHETIVVVNTNGRVVYSNSGLEVGDFKAGEFFRWSKLKKNQGLVFMSSSSHTAVATNGTGPGAVILATPLYQSSWDSGARRTVQTWSGALVVTVDLERLLAENLALLSPKDTHTHVWIMDHDGTIVLQSEHPEMDGNNVFHPPATVRPMPYLVRLRPKHARLHEWHHRVSAKEPA